MRKVSYKWNNVKQTHLPNLRYLLGRKKPGRNQKTITETETWNLIRSFPGSETHLKRRVPHTKINVRISCPRLYSLLLKCSVRKNLILQFLLEIALILRT